MAITSDKKKQRFLRTATEAGAIKGWYYSEAENRYYFISADPDQAGAFEYRTLKEMICHTHTNKMENKVSLSTSPLLNFNCMRRALSGGENCICSHCYSVAMNGQYEDLKAKLKENTYNLTLRPIMADEMADCDYYINKYEGVRFEAFGDIQTAGHMSNLLRIARHWPAQNFTLWTKNLYLVNSVLDTEGKPDNLILIYSNPWIDKPILDTSAPALRHCDKVFNVYTDEDTAEALGATVNCGARDCAVCQLCYTKNATAVVNELLKPNT